MSVYDEVEAINTPEGIIIRITTTTKMVGVVTHQMDIEDYIRFRKEYVSVIPQTGAEGRVYLQKSKRYLHRAILDYAGPLMVDHVDGNPLNNRRKNLRLSNKQTNQYNTRAHLDSKYSAYKGVTYMANTDGRKKRWVVAIKAGDEFRKKYCSSEIEAALQYNVWAKELHGEYAVLNSVTEFDKDLQFGNDAEEVFFVTHKKKLIREDGLRSDFTLKESGDKLELKVDRFDPDKTNNIFLERWSSGKYKTRGGPYKAEIDGSKYFVYMFWKTREIFCYCTKDLVSYLDRHYADDDLVTVAKSSQGTQGYIVPRADIEHLRVNFDEVL